MRRQSDSGPRRRRQQAGFTLIELMVTITLLGVLMAIAVPSFRDAAVGNRLSSVANAFVSSSHLARGEAIKRNADIKMCRSSDGVNCAAAGGWDVGWIVFNDADADNVLDTAETLIHRQPAIPSDFLLTSTTSALVFKGTGMIDAASEIQLKLCRALPSPASQDRELKVSVTGRVSASKTNTGTCVAL
jgi:type IV fimbrial biogenesis protein FimT